MKKILSAFIMLSLLVAGSLSAQTVAPTRTQISTCMQAATAKKNAAMRAADDAYKTARQNARKNNQRVGMFSKMNRDLQQTRRNAKEAAKAAFTRDRMACNQYGMMEKKLVVTLGTQNNSGVSGVAMLREDAGSVRVTLETVGGTGGNTPQPAHIHMGSCPTPGAVKYPLTAVVNGRSETTLSNTTLEAIKSQLPLAINIHKSETEMSVYLACGDVQF